MSADYFVTTILRIHFNDNSIIDIELDCKPGYYEIYPGLYTTKYSANTEEYWDSRRDWYDDKLRLLNKTNVLFDSKMWKSIDYKRSYNDIIINELLRKNLSIDLVSKIYKITYVE